MGTTTSLGLREISFIYILKVKLLFNTFPLVLLMSWPETVTSFSQSGWTSGFLALGGCALPEGPALPGREGNAEAIGLASSKGTM